MADIGVLPSRTSVQITSTAGASGTIPSATPRTAGCMSAEQADHLDTLWQAHLTAGGGPVMVIERPAQPSPGVSRAELHQMMSEMSKALAPPITLVPDSDVASRIADLEIRHEQLRQIVVAVLDQLDRLGTEQRFLEANALAKVRVE